MYAFQSMQNRYNVFGFCSLSIHYHVNSNEWESKIKWRREEWEREREIWARKKKTKTVEKSHTQTQSAPIYNRRLDLMWPGVNKVHIDWMCRRENIKSSKQLENRFSKNIYVGHRSSVSANVAYNAFESVSVFVFVLWPLASYICKPISVKALVHHIDWATKWINHLRLNYGQQRLKETNKCANGTNAAFVNIPYVSTSLWFEYNHMGDSNPWIII